MVKREKANYMIQSVSHALDVLEELCKSGGEVGVTELSKRLKLHKNMCKICNLGECDQTTKN